jgi:uncharacterized protein YpuA (DUF1002 family)
MSIAGTVVEDVAKFSVGKAAFPWLVAACVMALSATGLAGMYGGYEIAQGRHAADQIALAQAQAVALSQAADRLREARGRGDEIADRFEGKLDNIKIENKTFNNETRVETEKLVYTDCKLPDTGADLLKRHVDSVNARLLGSSTTTTPAKK